MTVDFARASPTGTSGRSRQWGIKKVKLTLLFLCCIGFNCLCQEIFVKKIDSKIDTSYYVIETPKVIYNPFLDTFLSNSICNFYLNLVMFPTCHGLF